MSSSNSLFPCRVWSRFEAKRKDGSVLKLRIQEAPKELFNEIIDFNVTYFVSDEHIQKSTGLASNLAALAEYKSVLMKMVKSWSVSICCEDKDSDTVEKILGVSSVQLNKEQVIPTGCQTKEMQKLIKIFLDLETLHKSPFHIYHIGRGMGVHPEYRGLGIASEFVKARRLAMIEENVSMTGAWMTSYGSQKAAEKDNWETIFEMTSKEFEIRYDVVTKDAPLTFKFMQVKNSRDNVKIIEDLI